jgi:hypothetical protein
MGADGGGGGGDFSGGGSGAGKSSSADAGAGAPFSDGGTGDYGTSAGGPGSLNFGAGDPGGGLFTGPQFAPQNVTGNTPTGTNVGGAQSGDTGGTQPTQNQPAAPPQPQQQQQDQIPLPRPRPAEAPGAPGSYQLGSPPSVPGPTGPTTAQADPLGAWAAQQGTDLNSLAARQQQASLGGTPAGDTLGQWAQGQQPQAPQAPQPTQTAQPAAAPTSQAAGPAADSGADESTTNQAQQPAATPPAASQAPASKGGGGAAAGGGGASQAAPGATGGGRGASGGMPFNPMQIMQALMRGGPMGGLQELAREVMGGQGGGLPYQTQGGGSPFGGPQGQNQYRTPATNGATPPTTNGATPPTTNGAAPGGPAAAAAQAANAAAPGGTPPFPPQPPAVDKPFGISGVPQAPGSAGAAPAPVQAHVNQASVARSQLTGTNTRPTAGFNSYLAQQRQPQVNELRDPRTRLQVAGMLALENAKDPIGPAESLMNRTSMLRDMGKNSSIAHMLHSGFYGPINAGQLQKGIQMYQSDPGLKARIDSAIDAAGRGSNVLGGATDQGMATDRNGRNPSGRVTRSGEVYNDWGGVRGSAQWRLQQQRYVQQYLAGGQ